VPRHLTEVGHAVDFDPPSAASLLVQLSHPNTAGWYYASARELLSTYGLVDVNQSQLWRHAPDLCIRNSFFRCTELRYEAAYEFLNHLSALSPASEGIFPIGFR